MVADVLTRSAAASSAAAPLSGLAGAWRRLRRRDGRHARAAEAVPAWLTPPPERPLPRDLDLPLRLFDPAALARSTPAVAPRAMALEPLLLDETLQRLRRLVG
ncbi:hypothetical protein KZ813_12085 [Sphingomonas sp. RHCKR7]|uniref:hypothetical protein n=1 Tax=Sphingomonas folli TaxID=2862497 RepID=UPI001CA5C387|nr:hypothetical protein [Sphingomonas folli]MBW6527581.1 hypothetical protein [Sphingomonas folli]